MHSQCKLRLTRQSHIGHITARPLRLPSSKFLGLSRGRGLGQGTRAGRDGVPGEETTVKRRSFVRVIVLAIAMVAVTSRPARTAPTTGDITLTKTTDTTSPLMSSV